MCTFYFFLKKSFFSQDGFVVFWFLWDCVLNNEYFLRMGIGILILKWLTLWDQNAFVLRMNFCMLSQVTRFIQGCELCFALNGWIFCFLFLLLWWKNFAFECFLNGLGLISSFFKIQISYYPLVLPWSYSSFSFIQLFQWHVFVKLHIITL